ncbi:PRC-barrel domain-containing protein [Methanopyrus kandleri]
MRILRDLIGKPVIDSSAKHIGEVLDVEFDEESGEVTTLIVGHSKRPGVLRKIKWLGGEEKAVRIPYSKVVAIEDMVLVEGRWVSRED